MSNLQLTQEKLDALRSEYRPRRPCAQLKYPRPKTKPEYQAIYPWLLPDETDPHFVFCAVCECRLSAKRSDLGKHEGSMKHSENAQRKAKIEPQAVVPDMKWEYNDDDEAMLPFEASNENDEDEDEEESAEAEGDDADLGAEDDGEEEPPLKQQRRISETDSQHSGMLDFLPLQVTINEMPHCQLSGSGLIQPPPSTTPQPCRITIKKVSAPLAKMATTSNTATTSGAAAAASIPSTAQSHEFSSKATITPIAPAAACYTPSSRQPQMYASRQLTVPYQLSQMSPQSPQRDSLELFFDSICATVKSLPPKLATEGKIRVMQLIGELELRAINEQEEMPAASPALDLLASAAAAAPDGPGCSQQNATVASTTK